MVIHAAPLLTPLRIEPGDPLGFSLTLFTESVLWEDFAKWVRAFQHLGASGLSGSRGRLALKQIQALAPSGEVIQQLYTDDRLVDSPNDCLWAMRFNGSGSLFCDVEVEFLTPTRLEQEREIIDYAPPFDVFFNQLVNHLEDLLSGFHTPPSTSGGSFLRTKDYLEELDGEIRLQMDMVTWTNYDCYSGRKKEKQSLSGLQGVLRYGQVPRALVSALRWGVFTHMGKYTSRGMGAFAILVDGIRYPPPFWNPEHFA